MRIFNISKKFAIVLLGNKNKIGKFIFDKIYAHFILILLAPNALNFYWIALRIMSRGTGSGENLLKSILEFKTNQLNEAAKSGLSGQKLESHRNFWNLVAKYESSCKRLANQKFIRPETYENVQTSLEKSKDKLAKIPTEPLQNLGHSQLKPQQERKL